MPDRFFEPASASVHPVRSRQTAWTLVGVVPVSVAVDLLALGFASCPSDLQAWLAGFVECAQHAYAGAESWGAPFPLSCMAAVLAIIHPGS